MPETTPLIKAALNLRVGAGFDVYFDPRNYGYKKLKPFLDSFECFETQETSNPKNDITKLVYVKVK